VLENTALNHILGQTNLLPAFLALALVLPELQHPLGVGLHSDFQCGLLLNDYYLAAFREIMRSISPLLATPFGYYFRHKRIHHQFAPLIKAIKHNDRYFD